LKSLVAINNGAGVDIIPNGSNDPGLYAQRLIFVEYMSDPDTSKSAPALRELAKVLEVPYIQLDKWKKTNSFQTLVAKRLRDKALNGSGLALAYEELMKLVSDPDIPVKVRAKAATDLAKLGQKQEEMYLKYKLAKDKTREKSTKRTYEQEVAEAEYEIIQEEAAE